MPEVFISPDQLATVHQDARVVDVRREEEYARGHIPGAVNIPFDRFRDPTDEMEGKLPTATAFAALLNDAGIAPDDSIVAYDDDHGVYASRFLVTAEVFGHPTDRLQLLDGDIETWSQTFETTTTVQDPQPTDYTCQRRPDGPLTSATDLEAALDSDAVIVDTRDPLEYDTVHLPSAVNFQWRDLVTDDTRQLKPRHEIEQILDGHGITQDRPVRLYCNTARRLSFVYLVLQALKYDDIAFYEGGIDAWAAYGGPVETTSA